MNSLEAIYVFLFLIFFVPFLVGGLIIFATEYPILSICIFVAVVSVIILVTYSAFKETEKEKWIESIRCDYCTEDARCNNCKNSYSEAKKKAE